jgi:hypothetical protein
MKKLIITSLAICLVFFGFAFLILFEANIDRTLGWWASYSRDSQTLPYSPYKIRRADSAYLRMDDANNVMFIDKHLFWKGEGAVALPEITKSGKLVRLIIKTGGKGYSNDVKASVTGSMGNSFVLGNVNVIDGEIKSVDIIKSSNWSSAPRAFWGEEALPFSGTIEKIFPSKQIMFEKQYLSGRIHGKWKRFTEIGIPVFSKDYRDGIKQGTHIFWYNEPLDPSDYSSQEHETMWLEWHHKAKEKFGKKYNGNESNKWIIKNYKLAGGSFQVKLLEHWEQNQKDGLFEGFDRFGNKTFKDEYKAGIRIKHRIFDKTKTKTFDRKVGE